MKNVLITGAHFDDAELGCGGAIMHHIAKGDNVFIYVPTLSGYSNENGDIIRDNTEARQEGEAAAKFLGANLICGNFETLKLEFSDKLNCELINIINNNKIDTIYTHFYDDIHHDHQALSKAVMHCSRHIKRVLMYKSNWYPSASEFKGNFYVDISKYIDKKTELISIFKTENARTNGKWIEYFKSEARINGLKIGTEYAEVFEPVKWLED